MTSILLIFVLVDRESLQFVMVFIKVAKQCFFLIFDFKVS